ncbi:SGNH/GDSL hydrolase family protein [Staphylococcus epidermidis]|uniref:SGNH/GDSL hydrolase family protein n=1 Tax=Staphylococcus epidermidis TaxID=1282 RepID=UPI00287F578D|nr:SGNH/GDSL hydrolase family protein [Staphylococcus epidermidis]
MRRNLINNYRFLEFPQETSIEIKQGDFTPISVKLDSTEMIKDDGKDAKVILINTDNEKVFETSVPAKNRIIEFVINKNLPKGRYFLEIVYNQMKFPSRDYKTIIINGSASLGSLKEINIISSDDIKNRFISEAKKELSADIDQLVSEKLNKYVIENQEDLKGQSISIANHEFDEKGNLNITFSDQTFIQIPKGKDGHNGEDGRDGLNGRDGQSVTTITERGISNNSSGIYVRTYKVDHEGIKQDLISETFVSDGKDGKDGTSVEIDHTEEIDNDLKIYFTNGKSLFLPKTKVVETNTSASTEISQLKDLVGVFIGDSITEVNLRTEKNYHQFIADRTGLKNINLGHSGTGYQDRKNAFTEIKEAPDFITVFLGTNDYGLVGGKTRELGTAKEHKAGTVAGSIYYTLLQLSNSFPTTPIGVMTPIPRAECNPFKEVANSKGYTLGQLTEVIKELASSFSFPVLDLYNESNLRVWNETVNKTFFSLSNGSYDGLHPNAKGHEYLSYMIERFIEDKLVVGTRFDYEHVDTTPTSLGNDVFKKAIKPEGMFWNTTQSLIINVTASDIDLDKFKLLKIKYKTIKLLILVVY